MSWDRGWNWRPSGLGLGLEAQLPEPTGSWPWAGPALRARSAASPAGSLPAPDLSADPAGPRLAPGSLVRLRCRAPRPGLQVALEREDARGRRLRALLRPAGTEAEFELPNVSVADSANYSCVYADPAPPFAGSAPSARLELRVDGEQGRAARASGRLRQESRKLEPSQGNLDRPYEN